MNGKQLLLLVFLGCNALWDLKKKEILLLPTVLFLACSGWLFLLEGGLPEVLLWNEIPGIFLLAAAFATGGSIGAGDALAVLAAGVYLELFSMLQVLRNTLAGILLISGGRIFWQHLKGEEYTRKQEIPMIPVLFLCVLIQLVF